MCLGLWKNRNHISLWCLVNNVTQQLSACWLSYCHELAYFLILRCLSFLLGAPAYSEFLSFWVLVTWHYLAWSTHLMLPFQLTHITTQFSFEGESYWIILAQPLNKLLKYLWLFVWVPKSLYSNQLWPLWCIMVLSVAPLGSFLHGSSK